MLGILDKTLRRLSGIVTSQYRTLVSKDIQWGLEREALRSTVDYVSRHMMTAIQFDDRFRLLEYASSVATRPGLVCEFGVGEGESINFLAERYKGTVHGFDSFRGLPEDWRPGYGVGKFTREGNPPVVKSNVQLHIGEFEKVIPPFIRDNTQDISFLHIDCDLYSSTKTVLGYLAERIVPGTVILFDEYFNYPGWQAHEFRAFQEFIGSHGVSYDYVGYNRLHEQVALRIKNEARS